LNTHDVALPLVKERPGSPARFFRFILLSPSEVGDTKNQERIERLYAFEGGRNAGILFHLSGDPAAAYSAFYNFQIECVSSRNQILLDSFATNVTDTVCVDMHLLG
jgi:hypothetical protein